MLSQIALYAAIEPTGHANSLSSIWRRELQLSLRTIYRCGSSVLVEFSFPAAPARPR